MQTIFTLFCDKKPLSGVYIPFRVSPPSESTTKEWSETTGDKSTQASDIEKVQKEKKCQTQLKMN
jgi:hypothetical protein